MSLEKAISSIEDEVGSGEGMGDVREGWGNRRSTKREGREGGIGQAPKGKKGEECELKSLS
jgi:hypothetical protein